MAHLDRIKLPSPIRLATPSRLAKSALLVLSLLVLAPLAAHAQGSPFDTGFNAIQGLFTGTIAKVASLVAIVIGGGRTGRFHRFATWRTDRLAMGGCGLREPRNPCSPLSCDDGPGRSQDGSFRKGCTARRCFGRVSAQAAAGWSVQSRNRLGVCLADDERQATALARNSLATIRATGSEGGEDPEAGRVPHLPSHVHNFADSEQRGSEGGTRAPTSCEQSHYAGSLRSGGNAEQATGSKQTCSDGAQQGRSTGLTGPNWTMTQIANSLQVLERIGGDDGTRTRGLCRDRAAF
jgi:type IV secretory pathway VirB2 component (pilin)